MRGTVPEAHAVAPGAATVSGFPPAGLDSGPRSAYAPVVRARRRWPGFLAILLLLCIGIGLVSASLPEPPDDYGYYDGDGDDDAVAAPDRLAILIDLAIGARGDVTSLLISTAFDGATVSVDRPIVRQSPPPLLRSPPIA